MMAQMQNPQAGAEQPQAGGAQEQRVNGERPGKHEQRVLNRNMGTPMNTESQLRTPVGAVMSAPGDQQASTQAIRRATVSSDEQVLRG